MRDAFLETLRCPACAGRFVLEVRARRDGHVEEGALRCACGQAFPVVAGVARVLPDDLAGTVEGRHADFFERHPDLRRARTPPPRPDTLRTLRSFGDEWHRFPAVLQVHDRIFRWYFEGPPEVDWRGRMALDAGCGMGRWLSLAQRAGGQVVGMDVSPAIDVVAGREGIGADLVQADLRWPPFAASSFDLVYSLGVLHHLEDPLAGLSRLAPLVRPGGELRFYVYRSLEDEGAMKRALLAGVALLRRLTTRLPFGLLHALVWLISALATALFLLPRRALRAWPLGDRLTRSFPLVHYADVPFGMLVAEQFDRFSAPLEGRHTRREVQGWVERIRFALVSVRPELGWRVVARRPG